MMIKGLFIPGGWESGGKESFRFRGEPDAAINGSIEKRFYPEAVAPGHEAFFFFIPKDKRKFAAQMLNRIESVIFIEVDEDFAVATSAEVMTAGRQLVHGHFIVVEFTVDDHCDVTGLIHDRLLSAGQIYDAQAPVAQQNAVFLA